MEKHIFDVTYSEKTDSTPTPATKYAIFLDKVEYTNMDRRE